MNAAEANSLPPMLADKADTYKFVMAAREKGEDAAALEKNERDSSRFIEQFKAKEAQERDDQELLSNGKWLNVVLDALGEDAAGEEELKRMCIYSVVGTRLNNKISTKTPLLNYYIPGGSQVGKSWILRTAGRTLLPSTDFLLFSAMSAKGLDYYAEELGPEAYRGKIIFIDETADLSPEARARLKVIMSIGQDEVSNLTVDDKKKSKRQSFTAMPTIWSCSAERFEDNERQFLNRPLIITVNEGVEQTTNIQRMQKDQDALGSFYTLESKKAQALRLMEKIREEKEPEAIVLFSDYYRPDNEQSRGEIPQFSSLVKAIALANRFGRPTVRAPDGHLIVFATLEDGFEATRLWGKFIRHKTTHMAERFLIVLDALNEIKLSSGQTTLNIEDVERAGKLVDDLAVELNTKTGKGWSIGYVRNMLSELGKEGLAEYHECMDGKNRWIALSHPSQASHFVDVMNILDGGEMLAKRIEELKTRSSHHHKEIRLPEDLKEQIIGKAVLPEPVKNEEAKPAAPELSQSEKVEGLKKLIKSGKLMMKDIERIAPEQRALIEQLRKRGRISVLGSGVLFWRE